MKVPKYIKEAITKHAEASQIIRDTDKIIRDWFVKNDINNDGVLDQYIDSCDMTSDPESFIEFLEKGSFEKGNNSEYE